jgi:hypothetical protein
MRSICKVLCGRKGNNVQNYLNSSSPSQSLSHFEAENKISHNNKSLITLYSMACAAPLGNM